MVPVKGISIGEVAKRTSLGVETIRFYEREGLIEEPPRKISGYRQYPEEVIDRIRLIRRAKELGFSLKEIRDLIEMQRSSTATCADVKNIIDAKVTELGQKIAELNKMKDILNTLSHHDNRDAVAAECPLFRHLASNEALF